MTLRQATTFCTSVLLLATGTLPAADEGQEAKTQQAAPQPKPASAKPFSIGASTPAPLYVGLRRSSYGLRKQNGDDAWWLSRAKTFATNFPGAQPLILQILSNYQDDGSAEIEFKRPESYHGTTTNMTFRRGSKLNHDQALSAYDVQGVKAILQFEPGNADVPACFEMAHLAFGHHPCVIGLAVDAEWFRTKESTDQTGLSILDAEAQRWMEQVMRFNPAWLLVLKHFEAKHLPATYRHPNLWLLTDSQEFASQTEWMTGPVIPESLRYPSHTSPYTHRRFKFEPTVCVGRDNGETTEGLRRAAHEPSPSPCGRERALWWCRNGVSAVATVGCACWGACWQLGLQLCAALAATSKRKLKGKRAGRTTDYGTTLATTIILHHQRQLKVTSDAG